MSIVGYHDDLHACAQCGKVGGTLSLQCEDCADKRIKHNTEALERRLTVEAKLAIAVEALELVDKAYCWFCYEYQSIDDSDHIDRKDEPVPCPHTISRTALARMKEEPVNQCDGCRAGIPVDEKGNHHMANGGRHSDLMACTKDRYR